MEGLLFFVAATEGDRQMHHHLNGAGPHGHDDTIVAPIPAPGRLERFRTRCQRLTAIRPAPRALPASVMTGESGQPGLRPPVSSTAS